MNYLKLLYSLPRKAHIPKPIHWNLLYHPSYCYEPLSLASWKINFRRIAGTDSLSFPLLVMVCFTISITPIPRAFPTWTGHTWSIFSPVLYCVQSSHYPTYTIKSNIFLGNNCFILKLISNIITNIVKIVIFFNMAQKYTNHILQPTQILPKDMKLIMLSVQNLSTKWSSWKGNVGQHIGSEKERGIWIISTSAVC